MIMNACTILVINVCKDKAKDVIELSNDNINIPTDTEIIENHKRTQLVSSDFLPL